MTAPFVRPFTVAVPDGELEDLRRRLAATRWPDPETVGDWSQGARLDEVRALVDHWAHGYDWRRFEARLNAVPQVVTTIDGLDIHALHARSPHPGALPLLLTHGWPGSVVEFLDLVGPLTDTVAHGGDAADAFHVVVPSLPGFGFSGKPTGPGWDVDRVAAAWVELMARLGYREWTAQGGDWGGVVTAALGEMRPAGLLGVHLNTPWAFPAQLPEDLTPDEQRAVDGLARYGGELGGASHVQGTRPQTIGYALADSPVGQAAWIYDKFHSRTQHDGRVEDAVDLDTVLDAVSLYWFTNTGASSARTYWENRAVSPVGPRLTLPVAVTVFPGDVPRMPRHWVEQAYPGLVHLGEAERGGHFAALEQPAFLVEEIRTGLRSLRVPCHPGTPAGRGTTMRQ